MSKKKFLIVALFGIVIPLVLLEWMSNVDSIDDLYKIGLGSFLIVLSGLISIKIKNNKEDNSDYV